MDPRQLRHFVAVAETLHFGHAAARLGMTQPPLSQSIRALEERLGAPLFQRTKRSVALTPFGAAWLPQVRVALAGIDALAGEAENILAGKRGRLDLSFVSTADYGILPALVQRFRRAYPEVDLHLSEATSDLQIAALLDGTGHAGLIIPQVGGSLPEGLCYQKLATEPLVAAVPESWIDEGRLTPQDGQLSAREMIAAPLVIFPRRAAPSFHDLVTEYHQSCGGHLKIAQEAIQMQTIISLVSAGMGIALVPASLRKMARAGVCYLTLAVNPPQLETGIAWRCDDPTPTLENFRHMAVEMAQTNS